MVWIFKFIVVCFKVVVLWYVQDCAVAGSLHCCSQAAKWTEFISNRSRWAWCRPKSAVC